MDLNNNKIDQETFTDANTGQSPSIQVNRTFKATLEQVWKAWTDPELVKAWWGPEGYSCPEAKIDFTVGGKYLIAMRNPEGKIIWSTGQYEEIIPLQSIVCTDQFSDEKGNPIEASQVGMPGNWPNTLYLLADFEPIGTFSTEIFLTHIGIPIEMQDECIKGWNSSLDKFQKLVESI